MPNTLFLRLEGPLQAWGDQQSKFVVRRTAEAPTKSGVIGLLCAALGVSRAQAEEKWLPALRGLRMGARIDRPGVRWWDYHTVGAKMQMRIADGVDKTKRGAMLTRREYLCDASFLVVLQGDPPLMEQLHAAVRNPQWALYLGRKCCPASRPLLESRPPDFPDFLSAIRDFPDLRSAIKAVAWQPRLKGDQPPATLDCLLDWEPTPGQPGAPPDALVWYDVPLTFETPAHAARFVVREQLHVGPGGELAIAERPTQNHTPPPPRPRADYRNTEYRQAREGCLRADHGLCVFCKCPATTVQHITYRRAGGGELPEDLRSLCRLCHDAVTMIEYGLGMGLDRINPEDPQWRDRIIAKRDEIVRFRSLETRRRRLSAEEVE
jgi:CRISPR system Cascade subunit CasD